MTDKTLTNLKFSIIMITVIILSFIKEVQIHSLRERIRIIEKLPFVNFEFDKDEHLKKFIVTDRVTGEELDTKTLIKK